jgi:hypothetical protein
LKSNDLTQSQLAQQLAQARERATQNNITSSSNTTRTALIANGKGGSEVSANREITTETTQPAIENAESATEAEKSEEQTKVDAFVDSDSAESETETAQPAESETETAQPAESETEIAESETETAQPTESETETAQPAESETEIAESETETAQPAESETETAQPAEIAEDRSLSSESETLEEWRDRVDTHTTCDEQIEPFVFEPIAQEPGVNFVHNVTAEVTAAADNETDPTGSPKPFTDEELRDLLPIGDDMNLDPATENTQSAELPKTLSPPSLLPKMLSPPPPLPMIIWALMMMT